ELRTRGLELDEGTLVLGDALAIEIGQRGNRSRRLADAAKVGRRKQQAQVAALSQLVHLDEPRSKAGPLGAVAIFELPHALVRARQLRPDRAVLDVDVLELLGPDLPIDLELPEIAEQ